VVVELATREASTPLLWWSEYHHVLAHNLLAAVVIAATVAALARRRLASAVLAFAMVHLHFVMDILGSRGPDGYDWPVPYLFPFSDSLQLSWSGQWALNAWPNIAFTVALIGLTLYLAWRRGYSVVGLLSPSADRAVVAALRHRFGTPRDCA